MRRLPVLLLLLLPSISPAQPVTISAAPDGAARITLATGKQTTIPKEPGQTSIREPRTAEDGTAGWLTEYKVANVPDPVAATLVVWRAGKIIRRFSTQQAFYSWTFVAAGKQVAYHAGPLHGELHSHCELHDVRTGRLIAMWDGDLESSNARPPWTKSLTH